MSDETKDTTVAVVLVQCSAHGTKGVLVGDTRITTSECCGTWDKVLHHWPRVPSDFIARALDQFAALRAPAPSEAVDERIVRHPNGHLMVERVPAWVPTEEQTSEALKSLGKAWPYLADHAPHIDGEFNTAHGNLTRYVERFRELLATHPAPARGVTVTEEMVEAGARALYDVPASAAPWASPFVRAHSWDSLEHRSGPDVRPSFREAARAILTAALTPDAEGGA